MDEFNDNATNLNEGNKKKSNKIITILATILSVVAIGLIGGGIYFAGNSKSVLIQSFGNLSSNLKKILDTTVTDEVSKKIATSDKVAVKGNLALNSSFGNYAVKYNILNDRVSKNSFFDLGLLINDEEVIGANILANQDNLYFKLKKFMDVYYYMSNEYLKYEESKEAEEINYKKMIDTVVEDIKENISEKDIVSSKTKITVNGKELKATKLTYTFTYSRLSKILLAILEDFKSDDLVSDLSKISGLEKSEIVDAIEDTITSIKNDQSNPDEKLFDYSVYYRGVNNVVKYELGDDEFVMSYVHNDNFTEISASLNEGNSDNTKLVVTITGDKNKYDFNADLVTADNSGNLNVKGKYEKNGDNSKFDATLTVDGQSMALVGESKLLDKNISKTETTIKVTFDGQELFNLVVTSEVDFDNVNIDTSVIKGAKNIEDVTPEEMEEIQNKLLNDPVIAAFIEGFASGFGSVENPSPEIDS